MAGGRIVGLAPPLDQDLSFARFQPLPNDLHISIGGSIGGEKYRLLAGKEVWIAVARLSFTGIQRVPTTDIQVSPLDSVNRIPYATVVGN